MVVRAQVDQALDFVRQIKSIDSELLATLALPAVLLVATLLVVQLGFVIFPPRFIDHHQIAMSHAVSGSARCLITSGWDCNSENRVLTVLLLLLCYSNVERKIDCLVIP